ncbi:little elongation complex subunit 1 [Alosa pseudoharengus]|uniref:little elongation complex subunit 1 n=1 Tax=Alosa pseudoharengus TaxID=34774 RepID=UPI003F8CAC1A
MMPGETQARTAGVAPDGTAGTCQNCAVLNETLHEYMTSFLALKQKIIETDKVLNEFKDKCDELQKTQRENADLHSHLDELLLNVAPFDSLHKEDVYMQEELQRTKGFLKQCQDGPADLRNRDPEAQTLKDRIIFQLKILQDSNLKQSAVVTSLQNENESLENKLQQTQTLFQQKKLQKLEKEINKEKKSSGTQTERKELCSTVVQTETAERCSTAVQTNPTRTASVLVQTDPTEESMMDLRKIRELVTGLWQCVLPPSLSEMPPQLGSLTCHSPLVRPVSPAGVPVPKERLHMSPVPLSPANVPRTPVPTPARPAAPCGKAPLPAEEVLDLFRWLPPLLSPIPSPVLQRSNVEEDLQLSDEEDEEELQTFKQEDVKEAAFLANGLKTNGQLRSPESPPEVKFHQTSLSDTHGQTTDRKSEAVCLRINGKSRRTAAPVPTSAGSPGEREGHGEEMASVDDVMESEVVRDVVMPSAEACGDGTADMEWDPTSVDGLEGVHTDPAVGSGTEPYHSSGFGVTNGVGLLETKEDNTELKDSPLRNGPATLKPVDDSEMMVCNVELHEEQISYIQPPLTDFASTPKPQVKDQIARISKKCTGEALGSESLNGIQNTHDLNQNEVQNTVSSGVGQNGQCPNHHGPVNSRIRREQKQNSSSYTPDVGNTALRDECQNGQHQTSTDVRSNADLSKGTCGARRGKPSADVCGDIESSEDYRTPQRKVRVAHSRRESQQPAGSINGTSVERGSKEKPSKDLTCGTDTQTPSSPVARDGVDVWCVDDDVDLVTNKNTERSRVSRGDTTTNSVDAPPALQSQEDPQPEVEEQMQEHPQRTQENSNGHMQEEDARVPDVQSPDRPVITNGTATLKHSADGVVHTNGFGGSHCASEDEGSYTRVKGLLESLQPLSTASLISPRESVRNIRSMMGPPLRPLLPPLMSTPPKPGRLDPRGLAASPDGSEGAAAMPSANLALRNGPQKISFSPATTTTAATATPTTPSPCKSVHSSPLQFGSATPKHAVPVPCRHPAPLNPTSPATPAPAQENSMQMLDSMYPELSAQARTLNILRGNVCNLVRPGPAPAPEPSTPPQAPGSHAASGFNSVTTAFTKTQQAGKRSGTNVLLPKSAKKLRLGNSPVTVSARPPSDLAIEPLPTDRESKQPQTPNGLHVVKNDRITPLDNAGSSKECVISQALAKLGSSCFDLLVVVKSHVFIKRISSVPILRDEEKELVSDFCTTHKSLTEDFLSAILAQLKAERTTLGGDHLQSLCRVYTALCRQNKDRLKANTLAYSLLKEDFPDAAKHLLFMVTTWPSLLTRESTLCRAIRSVARTRAQGDILRCLNAYLHWDSNPPCDIPQLINSTMMALRTGENMQFQPHSRHGDDLCPTSWEYIFTLDLLCAHQKWKWTHDNIIRNDLWPIMNAWVTQPRTPKGPIQDVTVAAVLRLIGRLGQQGIKEKYSAAVRKMASVINMLGKQGQAEGVLWEVQLAAAYAIYDLSPSNPKEALAALAEWRGEATGPVPPGITSCLTQISSLSRKVSS